MIYTRKIHIPDKTQQELYSQILEKIDLLMHESFMKNMRIEKDPLNLMFKVSGWIFSGSLVCRDAEVELHLKFSLLGVGFRSQLDQGIDRWLLKTFGLLK